MARRSLEDILGTDYAAPASPDVVNADTLADMFGVTVRNVRQLAADGILPRVGAGQYRLRDAVRGYVEHVRKKRPGANERERLAAAQADLAELKAAALRGDMVESGAVAREWEGVLRDVRAAMLAVPSRVAARLDLSPAHVRELDAEIRAALAGLAEASA